MVHIYFYLYMTCAR